MKLRNSLLAAVILLTGIQGHARNSLAAASPDAAQFIGELQEEMEAIKSFGHICSGGGRKWAKIEQLRIRAGSSSVVSRLRNGLQRLDRRCVGVAETSGRLDPNGNELVIFQRIERIQDISAEDKKNCLHFWSDWISVSRVLESQVSPLLQIFKQACVNPRPASGQSSSSSSSQGRG